MENKKYIKLLFVLVCICFLLVGYFNFEKIITFFNDKEWEFAESFATINVENISQVEAGKSLLVLTNNKLELYEDSAISEYSENLVTTGVICDTSDDYLVVVLKDTNTISLFKESELIWQKKYNWTILNASVNKNGYVTVIYSQAGYKSSIKIFKPSGEELFTTYLASTYALDVEISNDNKILYIAEIDTEGIKIKSNIKLIEITALEFATNASQKVETLLDGTDTLITDIEYSNLNKLFILRESGVDVIDNEKKIKNIGEFEIKNTLFSSIKNLNYPIAIEKKSTGIFTNETNLKIFKDEETLEINIEKTPQGIDTMKDIIALNLGDEVLFLNTNGKVEKRYELERQLSDIKLYNNGKLAALIFRDRIELIKL